LSPEAGRRTLTRSRELQTIPFKASKWIITTCWLRSIISRSRSPWIG